MSIRRGKKWIATAGIANVRAGRVAMTANLPERIANAALMTTLTTGKCGLPPAFRWRRMREHLNEGRIKGACFYYVQMPEERIADYEARLLSRHQFNTGRLPEFNRQGP